MRKFNGPPLAAEFDDPLGKILVDFAGQHLLDDVERVGVGIAAALDELGFAIRPRPWPD